MNQPHPMSELIDELAELTDRWRPRLAGEVIDILLDAYNALMKLWQSLPVVDKDELN